MPAVFVHGVPDTEQMWDPLLEVLDRQDIIRLSLPGFRTDVPDDWAATKEAYAAWLEGELDHIGVPVDLVAHDWGALLAQRLASVRPDLIRTLACGSGPLDADYTWHAMAQAWQTPEVGEQIMAAMLAMSNDDLAAGLAAGGAPPDLAVLQASNIDARMTECILRLYRSAVTVGVEWQPAVDAMARRPAMVFHGADDPFLDVGVAERLAQRLGAELVVFGSCGHWWAWARASETAAALTRLWR
jgi:Predicted hydrolases or acyltransferases (alpha/beta hydrolase superfamily)